MRPIRLICPICGEEMVVEGYGIQRRIHRSLGKGVLLPGRTKSYANYECPCGCVVKYSGEKSCWQKKCECKSCINFQKHYPYEAYECESCKKWKSEPR